METSLGAVDPPASTLLAGYVTNHCDARSKKLNFLLVKRKYEGHPKS